MAPRAALGAALIRDALVLAALEARVCAVLHAPVKGDLLRGQGEVVGVRRGGGGGVRQVVEPIRGLLGPNRVQCPPPLHSHLLYRPFMAFLCFCSEHQK